MTPPELTTDVAVIGGGPAGLAAATELRRRGVARVTLFERAAEAGGMPRHCGHPPFGMREFGRVLSGPAYARRLVARAQAAGVVILAGHSVVALEAGGRLSVATPEGMLRVQAAQVILATGTRETTRAQALLPGQRPLGVMNTGALQGFVYLEGRVPFRRPLIAGSEIVTLSALLTCRRHGIRPVALVEPEARVRSRLPVALLARAMGVPLFTATRITAIEGQARVAQVRLEGPGGSRELACDGVLLTGRFTPEAGLARAAGLAIDAATGGPVIDGFARASDPQVWVAGNLLHPVETAGRCWAEGRQVARLVLAARAQAPAAPSLPVTAGAGLRWVVPQQLAPGEADAGLGRLNLRLAAHAEGRLRLETADGRLLAARRVAAGPETPLTLSLDAVAIPADAGALVVRLEGAA